MHAVWFTIGNTPITLTRVGVLLIILCVVWWSANAVERVLARLPEKNKNISPSGIYAIGRILRYLVWIFGSIIGLNFIGVNLSSLALLGGALGVGIGFGLQNIFNNLISGIIILLEKTLKVGDFVDLESGIMGHVSEINMRYTRITTNDSVDVIVPNSEFINGRVINWTFGAMRRRMHIPFGVAYGTNKETVKQAALNAASSVSHTIEDSAHKTGVWLVNMGDSSLDFELIVWVGAEGVRAPKKVEAEYLWAIETELVNAGIEIPFPQRDLNLRSGPIELNINRDRN